MRFSLMEYSSDVVLKFILEQLWRIDITHVFSQRLLLFSTGYQHVGGVTTLRFTSKKRDMTLEKRNL